MRADRAMRR
jgi:membrane fusion protein, multidrug efflux system